ncbi:hypothetical protein EPO56_01790 [Patescibacteria group bacterium]|nr:MAG: hypothetical protein EPO56_01790 [Patescibacteria group bacterium]
MIFSVSLFLLSSTLLTGFIVFRLWEEKRGHRLWALKREHADHVVTDMYHRAITGNVPYRYRTAFIVFLQKGIHEVVLLLVAGLRSIERPLTRLSYRMRMAVPQPKGKEVSSFLRTIVPRKKKQVEPVLTRDSNSSEKSV